MTKDSNIEKSTLKLGTVGALILLAGSIVATHFQGQAAARNYTDTKVQEVATQTNEKLDKMQENLDRIEGNVNKNNIDVAVIKQILIQNFGNPKINLKEIR